MGYGHNKITFTPWFIHAESSYAPRNGSYPSINDSIDDDDDDLEFLGTPPASKPVNNSSDEKAKSPHPHESIGRPLALPVALSGTPIIPQSETITSAQDPIYNKALFKELNKGLLELDSYYELLKQQSSLDIFSRLAENTSTGKKAAVDEVWDEAAANGDTVTLNLILALENCHEILEELSKDTNTSELISALEDTAEFLYQPIEIIDFCKASIRSCYTHEKAELFDQSAYQRISQHLAKLDVQLTGYPTQAQRLKTESIIANNLQALERQGYPRRIVLNELQLEVRDKAKLYPNSQLTIIYLETFMHY